MVFTTINKLATQRQEDRCCSTLNRIMVRNRQGQAGHAKTLISTLLCEPRGQTAAPRRSCSVKVVIPAVRGRLHCQWLSGRDDTQVKHTVFPPEKKVEWLEGRRCSKAARVTVHCMKNWCRSNTLVLCIWSTNDNSRRGILCYSYKYNKSII